LRFFKNTQTSNFLKIHSVGMQRRSMQK